MRSSIVKFILLAIFTICALPSVAQCPEFAYLNGTYVKKGAGYSIEAKIDFKGQKAPEGSVYRSDFDSPEVPVERYYGYIKLTSGGHTEGYDIVSATAGGDGPILELAAWQTGVAQLAYPMFYNNTLVMDSGMMFEEAYMHEKLTKQTAPRKKSKRRK